MTTFLKMNADGSVTETREIEQSKLMQCKHFIMMPDHYREDGSCKCDDLEHRKMMMKEWGYKKKDFVGIPLRKG